ncbi:MAG: hypothetical protein H0X13_02390 [Ramlibacter sp.]|nr:hypothetical protein [Ramlibacter sp.]
MRPASLALSTIAEYVAAVCADTYLLCTARRTDVRYRISRDPRTLANIGRLRCDVYRNAKSAYLIDELDGNGLDRFDRTATAFVAELRSAEDEIFAAVRAVPHPFEVLDFVTENFLTANLGTHSLKRTVEVSRLVSSRPDRKVTNGLLLFGGIYLALTGITRYFAYVALPESPASRPVAGSFQIPHRNRGGYTIVSGSIAKHAAKIGPRLWRNTKFRGSAGVAKHPKRI